MKELARTRSLWNYLNHAPTTSKTFSRSVRRSSRTRRRWRLSLRIISRNAWRTSTLSSPMRSSRKSTRRSAQLTTTPSTKARTRNGNDSAMISSWRRWTPKVLRSPSWTRASQGNPLISCMIDWRVFLNSQIFILIFWTVRIPCFQKRNARTLCLSSIAGIKTRVICSTSQCFPWELPSRTSQTSQIKTPVRTTTANPLTKQRGRKAKRSLRSRRRRKMKNACSHPTPCLNPSRKWSTWRIS